MEVKLQSPRFRVVPTPTGFRADVPSKRNWLVVLFLLAWLGGWVFGELSASKELLNPTDQSPVAFLSFWVVGWTIGGMLAVAALLWQLAGREVIDIDAANLTYRVQVFGIGRSRSFQAMEVKDLRSVAYESSLFQNQRILFPPIFGAGYGPVAFDNGARTFRLAPSLDDAEAKMLVAELSSHLPRRLR